MLDYYLLDLRYVIFHGTIHIVHCYGQCYTSKALSSLTALRLNIAAISGVHSHMFTDSMIVFVLTVKDSD